MTDYAISGMIICQNICSYLEGSDMWVLFQQVGSVISLLKLTGDVKDRLLLDDHI